MAGYQEKPGDLSVFKNDHKEKDTHPDYRIVGTGLDGQKIKGALWLKKDRNGKTYMSGKIELDQPRYDSQSFRGSDQSRMADSRRDDTFGDGSDVPF